MFYKGECEHAVRRDRTRAIGMQSALLRCRHALHAIGETGGSGGPVRSAYTTGPPARPPNPAIAVDARLGHRAGAAGLFLPRPALGEETIMQTTLIHSAETIRAHFAPDSWQARFFESFHRDLNSKERTFPCTFGSLGSERGGLRFLFVEDFRSGLRTSTVLGADAAGVHRRVQVDRPDDVAGVLLQPRREAARPSSSTSRRSGTCCSSCTSATQAPVAGRYPDRSQRSGLGVLLRRRHASSWSATRRCTSTGSAAGRWVSTSLPAALGVRGHHRRHQGRPGGATGDPQAPAQLRPDRSLPEAGQLRRRDQPRVAAVFHPGPQRDRAETGARSTSPASTGSRGDETTR